MILSEFMPKVQSVYLFPDGHSTVPSLFDGHD